LRDQVELHPEIALQARIATKPLMGRRFLLVTMPAGPFGRHMARQLRARGASVRRVALNGGDLLDWGFGDLVIARCGFDEWPAFIERALVEHSITDIVVFGDATPYCAGAVAAARSTRTRIWVIENGYQRPNWVTVEQSGVNANSPMPRDANAYDDVDVDTPGDFNPPVGAITPYHVMNTFNYFAGVILAWPIFRGYRYPYALRIWPQAFGHLRRYLIWLERREAFTQEAEAVLDDPRPFYLACLQREGDSQLLIHSPVKTNRAFMASVISSFASHAPADSRLVVKNHPLDPGVEDLAGVCRTLASSHGVADRLTFLEGGVFAHLARGALGVVAVNSTAALAALEFGRPVKLLGEALFDIPGLTDRRPLDDFWNAPVAPDAALLARFRRRLRLRTQVYGSYHNPKVIPRTAAGIVARIVSPDREFWA
jgi:capsular polysaccharide export protein